MRRAVAVSLQFWLHPKETSMTTTRSAQGTTQGPVLHVAFELGQWQWKIATTVGLGQAPRLRSVPARDRQAVLDEIARAKKRFGLPDETPVVSCYEAGRDGFWLHRWLVSVGVANQVVDSAAIQVDRKKRRAKSDPLDAAALVAQLVRFHLGEKKALALVRILSEEAEDQRQLHRELTALKDERTSLTNQIKGHLVAQGLVVPSINDQFAQWLAQARCWNGKPVPAELAARLGRIFERWQ